MYESLGEVQLKSGETVERCVVTGPQPDWTERILHLLGHKGPRWQQQAELMLGSDQGIESRYYLLHRQGQPFAHIMTNEVAGVGILGHVYTVLADRRQGSATLLFDALVPHFRGRGGRALFLGTGYDSPPFHIYAKFGFDSIEPQSGYMDLYTDSADVFNGSYFARGPTEIQPMRWQHWPASAALFCGPWPGVVRCAVYRLYGRTSSECPLLPLVFDSLARLEEGRASCGLALVRPETTAVVGLACFGTHPLWPASTLVDVYCHPAYWQRGADLLDALQPPDNLRQLAYVDAACSAKAELLEAAGFQRTAVLQQRIDADTARGVRLDVTLFEKAPSPVHQNARL